MANNFTENLGVAKDVVVDKKRSMAQKIKPNSFRKDNPRLFPQKYVSSVNSPTDFSMKGVNDKGVPLFYKGNNLMRK